VRRDLGFESIQEIDYDDVFKGCSVYCEMILTPEQARRKTAAACQAALTKRGVAVLVVPADVANAASHEEPPYAVHAKRPIVRPTDSDHLHLSGACAGVTTERPHRGGSLGLRMLACLHSVLGCRPLVRLLRHPFASPFEPLRAPPFGGSYEGRDCTTSMREKKRPCLPF